MKVHTRLSPHTLARSLLLAALGALAGCGDAVDGDARQGAEGGSAAVASRAREDSVGGADPHRGRDGDQRLRPIERAGWTAPRWELPRSRLSRAVVRRESAARAAAAATPAPKTP